MKRIAIMLLLTTLFASAVAAQTNSIDWRYGRPGVRVVTNAPSRAEFACAITNLGVWLNDAPVTNGASFSFATPESVSAITDMFGPIWELNQGLNAHTTSTLNPHNVTAAQVNAVTNGGVSYDGMPVTNGTIIIRLENVRAVLWQDDVYRLYLIE